MPLEPEDRTVVELPSPPSTKRLQTKSGRKPGKARVVVTFHVEIDLEERRKLAKNAIDTDAVSIMRDHVAKAFDPEMADSLKMIFLSGLLSNSMSMEVDVAK